VIFTRRQFLAGVATALSTRKDARNNVVFTLQPAGTKRDVPWLREVLEPPRTINASPRRLAPLTVDDGRTITTLAAWERRRGELERAWRDVLGTLEIERGRPPKTEIVEKEHVGDVIRERIQYFVEPDVRTEAYVLRPRQSRGRRPGAIVFHTTTPESIRQPAGLSDVAEKHFGLALARRGFVAFCPRNFLWPETTRMAANEETRRFRERHPGATGMGKMLHDGQVALDILASRPDVDPTRIGCIGHSLGAKEALYLTAFDSRIAATVSSEGGIGLKMSNWDAPWYLGDIVNDPAFAREHHELLALAAPRPFLLVGGDSADGDASWPWIAAALPVYRLYATPPRLGLLNHKRGHAVPPDIEPRLIEWLDTYV
jgi:dienelactone hydrolase